ncbi:MAG TPA: galactose-1-phosphate uridylyltransferase [Clostridia bacterium]
MSNKTPQELIEDLLCYSNTHLFLPLSDNIYARNKLLAKLHLVEPSNNESQYSENGDISLVKSPAKILSGLSDYAIEKGIIEPNKRVNFETEIMDIVCPPPSFIIDMFDQIACEKNIKEACLFLYDYCIKSNYIRYDEVAANLSWTAPAEKADLEITINIAKPEKDNKKTAELLKKPQTGYPKCPLCKENVGFAGNDTIPSKLTLRTIPIFLNEELWHFQFSPYRYYNEHCIVFSDEHVPMNVNQTTVVRLFDFIDLFPHYFIGSNAALPRIGGSILNHDHYQGGAYKMPLYKTKIKYRFSSPNYPDVRIVAPDWYNNVIRIESKNRASLEKLFGEILDFFLEYNNEKLNIIAHTNEQHNAVTPIARFNEDGEYSLDIILRNNRTDTAHPDGIFHVSPDLHNIKKESIGLIEAMGVFILPGRLAQEAEDIKDFLVGKSKLHELSDPNHPLVHHTGMIAQLINDCGTNLSDEDAGAAIEQYINKACERILKCTALFKDDEEGNKAFLKMMKDMGFVLVN